MVGQTTKSQNHAVVRCRMGESFPQSGTGWSVSGQTVECGTGERVPKSGVDGERVGTKWHRKCVGREQVMLRRDVDVGTEIRKGNGREVSGRG